MVTPEKSELLSLDDGERGVAIGDISIGVGMGAGVTGGIGTKELKGVGKTPAAFFSAKSKCGAGSSWSGGIGGNMTADLLIFLMFSTGLF